MSVIKRYKVGSYRMAEHGDMVFYDDYLEAINRAKIDAAREAFIEGACWEAQEQSYHEPYMKIAADKYIEQLKEQE